MNSFFSGDDLDALWPSPMIPLPPDLQCTAAHPPVDPHSVNRSSPGWSFERFMHEAGSPPSASSVASSATVGPSATSRAPSSSPWTQEGVVDDRAALEVKNPTATPPQLPSRHPPPVAAPLNCDDYSAILKNQLHQACAAFAQSRKTTAKPLGPTSITDEKESLSSNPSELGSEPLVPVGPGDSKLRTDSQSLSIPTLPTSQKKSGAQCGLTTSESSREQSDDDDLGDAEITGHMGHGDDKRARRMQSNRDSARRSRRRKQEHLNELEKQVAQLRIENSSLSQHLTDVSQKFKDAAVDNRVLKADIETLRAKVKMAEDTVKRATGFNNIIQPVHSIPSMGAPLNSDHFSRQGVPNITGASQNQKLGSVLPSNTPGSAPHVSTGQNVARNKMVQTYPVQLASGADQIHKGVSGC